MFFVRLRLIWRAVCREMAVLYFLVMVGTIFCFGERRFDRPFLCFTWFAKRADIFPPPKSLIATVV
jgi:hypothetical protein